MEERKAAYEQKKLEEKLEKELKEKKIETFLETVKPNVETNPARMMSFTLVSNFLTSSDNLNPTICIIG